MMKETRATVYVSDTPAATLVKSGGTTAFSYLPSYLNNESSRPVATTLPLTSQTHYTPHGSLPAFFSGLLPEGRRLGVLQRSVKTSRDDELSLLLAVGSDTVGNVTIGDASGGVRHPDPIVDITADHVDFASALVKSGIADPVALPGFQEKASARTIAFPTRSSAHVPTDSILKLSPADFPGLVDNESWCYRTIIPAAKKLHIPVSRSSVISDDNGLAGLLVNRFDRQFTEKEASAVKFAVEDGTQVMDLPPSEKYSIPFEELSLALASNCRSPLLALRSIAFQLAFAWLTGNGDLHAKNLSIVDYGDGFTMSPIYDIPSTVPYGDSTLALEVQGRKVGLSRKRFLQFCHDVGLPEPVGDKVANVAVTATADFADGLIAAMPTTALSSRAARDITRVLAARRRHWV